MDRTQNIFDESMKKLVYRLCQNMAKSIVNNLLQDVDSDPAHVEEDGTYNNHPPAVSERSGEQKPVMYTNLSETAKESSSAAMSNTSSDQNHEQTRHKQ